ncbi:MAG: protein-L-isoaspartate(D-aspartate) O-methyltransferase [Acidobacteria bacterium]|nr:protein-L-isoaspartate(D-aspartate) O-methyltransferase [Acidobacteriota bacterium]
MKRSRPRRLTALALGGLTIWCCAGAGLERGHPGAAAAAQDAGRAGERERMVDMQIRARGVRDPRVLEAMRTVPRHRFVPPELQDQAYADTPLPIGSQQTISQPYIVAYMTEALDLPPDAVVLEVGTGSGYQAAVLAAVAREVYSIEIVPELAARSAQVLTDLAYDNIHLRTGDGYRGWPEAAPFDGIVVTAAPDHVPPALVDQLAVGGRLVIPVGRYSQDMRIVTRTADGAVSETTIPVRFVPMTGEAEQR